jgi:hypothetical protein
VTQNVGVCIQRSMEAGLRAVAIHSRNGANNAATAAGSPVSASSSTAARSRHRSQRWRRSGARCPQPVHTPIVLPRRRSHVSQIAPPSTRRCAARGFSQSRHVTIVVRRLAHPRQIARCGSPA